MAHSLDTDGLRRDPRTPVELLRRMVRIRTIEEMIAQRYPEGRMRCPVHLSVGQEGVAAAAGLALRSEDQALSTHRSHAHYLGKGGNLNAMVAELHGKATGCSSGRGGSMHLIDLAVGFLGSTAIVGNSIPLGVGAALTDKVLNNGLISCIFLGDAAVETGYFHESANFAVLRKLPVLFICENNFYSVYTHLHERQPESRRIYQLAGAYGMQADEGDGNDALSAYAKIWDTAEGIRRGNGPAFLEFLTYRWREHCGPAYDNDLGYRTKDEFEEWKLRDPIPRLQKQLCRAEVLTHEDVRRIEDDATEEAESAFRFAADSAYPSSDDAFTHLFSP